MSRKNLRLHKKQKFVKILWNNFFSSSETRGIYEFRNIRSIQSRRF